MRNTQILRIPIKNISDHPLGANKKETNIFRTKIYSFSTHCPHLMTLMIYLFTDWCTWKYNTVSLNAINLFNVTDKITQQQKINPKWLSHCSFCYLPLTPTLAERKNIEIILFSPSLAFSYSSYSIYSVWMLLSVIVLL